MNLLSVTLFPCLPAMRISISLLLTNAVELVFHQNQFLRKTNLREEMKGNAI